MSNKILGKLFKVSGSKIRQLYLTRFEQIKKRDLSSLMRYQQSLSTANRKRFGFRFLKKHEIEWLTSAVTLRNQTSLSLVDRCRHFVREFPTAKMNPTLLRLVYRKYGIKKKKYRWYKTPKEQDAEKQR